MDRSEVLKKLLRVLNKIECKEIAEEEILIKLKDGRVIKFKVLIEKEIGLKLLKPS